MALYGVLEAFPLPDLLRLLAATGKEGRLHVKSERGDGWLWFYEGMVTAAATDWSHSTATPTDVLFDLLRLREGSFAFEPDQPTPGSGPPLDVEQLLHDTQALLHEWTQLQTTVPSLDHHVRLVDALLQDEVTIQARHWPTIIALGSALTVNQLITKLDRGELDTTRTVHELIQLGIIDITPPTPTPDTSHGHRPAPPPRVST